jgi:L-alanine-DL-glutamate epimerase-like enolase superfamily enzyme
MKITNVEAIPLQYSMDEAIMDSFCFTKTRSLALVKIETDEGLLGYGEASTYGGSLDAVTVVIEKELKPLLIGQDPLLKEMLWQRMYKKYYQHGRGGIVLGAISGIDIALWDLSGKIAGMPLYKMLGGYSNRIRAYASAGFYMEGKGLKELADEMRGYVEEGFTAVKIKVGRVPTIPGSELAILPEGNRCNVSLKDDIERVRVVRETIGDTVDLLIDVNNSWDVETAIKTAKALEEYNLYYIEEPVITEDIDGSARLAAATTIPIAGYETAYTRFEFRNLIARKAVDIVQPDVVWTGGITECMKIAALASAYHLQVLPHGFASAICMAANLHLIAAISNGEMMEFDRHRNPLREELITEPFNIDKDGYIILSDEPGLGVTINEEVLEKYRYQPG